MIRDDDKWVRDLFESAASDWTSPAFANRVLYVPVSLDLEVIRRCASVLSDVELQRAAGFITDEGRAQFIQRRAFRRYCGALASGSRRLLSRIVFEETENGRPWLRDYPDLWFSFSSCRLGLIGAWSTTHGLGVDLEDQTTVVEAVELAQMYFTRSEARAVEKEGSARAQMFLQLWSLKEAALKSIGEGLPFGLDAFEFELDGGLRVVDAPGDHGGAGSFSAYLFDRPDVNAALVARRLH